MKHKLLTLFFALVAAVVASTAMAADKGAVISFKERTVDFGNIHAKDGKVTAIYRFENTGTEPLVIVTVTNGGCGCTVPSYPKAPIAPGKSGEIKITFDPSGRRGEINREVKVKTNASKKRIALKFKCMILPD